MGITVKDLLNNIETDDPYYVTIAYKDEELYCGYNDEVPGELEKRRVDLVNLDFRSEELYITLQK